MLDLTSPLFPLEELSPKTFVKLPKTPHAESKSVKLYIILAEPHLFLEGFTKDEVMSRPPSILRGCVFLRIIHPVKIKELSLKLSGVSRTEWPEGIPPKKTELFETKGIINHTWPFFNYLNNYPISHNKRNNADLFIPKNDSDVSVFSLEGSQNNNNKNNNNNNITPVSSYSDLKPVMSPTNILKSFRSQTTSSHSIHSSDLNSTLSNGGNNNSSDDNKYFPPGDYVYSFEMPIQSSLPESVSVTFGSISYNLEAHLERSGTFKSNLTAKRPVSIVRTPFENSNEENEPIIIDRDWENRLQYDIVISSKQIILNSYLPISFRMIPLEKIKIHRLRVYITEHLEYYCHNKKVHRTEPPKKILLLEHKPTAPSDNLLSLGNDEIGGVELDFQVFIPEYYNEKFHLHPDTTSEDIQSHHWIKICIRISKSEPTPEDPNKRKQYELSIDSPMHILSSHCVHANTLLPSYEEQVKIDSINNGSTTDSNSVKTLTPKHNSASIIKRQSIDKMMSPRVDSILDANLFKPDSSVPIEMLSPQAKPFSPIASPQLNAINPELRENTFRGFDLSPIISPISIGNRSRSNSKAPNLRNRAISPMMRSSSSINQVPVAVRLPSSSSINEPPPPPFVLHPPTYAEATVDSNNTNTNRKVPKPKQRRITNSSVESSHSTNSGNSNGSGNSGIYLGGLNSSSTTSSSSATTNNTNNTNTNNNKQQINTPQPSTRISLKLASSMNNLSRLGNFASSGTGTTAVSIPDESTPSISSFLDSPIPSHEPINNLNNINNNSTISMNSRGRNPERTKGSTNNKTISREQSPSFDLAENTDLKFKITPIRSASASPFLKPHNDNRSTSPIRSASPIPIIAQDRGLNKLINATFTPGFTVDKSKKVIEDNNNHTIVSPLIKVTNSNHNSNDTRSPILTSDLDSILIAPEEHEMETSSINIPLFNHSINHGDRDLDDELINSDSSDEIISNGKLSDNYNLHSNTIGSINSLDLMLSNQSSNTLSNIVTRGSLSGPTGINNRNEPILGGMSLNYLGNELNDDIATDITNMSFNNNNYNNNNNNRSNYSSSSTSPTKHNTSSTTQSNGISWTKLRNPNL
ncbi:Aly1 protein [Pichia kluyveri]|uniref:Aly1 protein n=1 Tax=Pichia kluyveri TaxID=36015 RepID=A0AAV5R224_PICKL|nr:Aly1 protein [Pichia kluyveri]